MPYQPRPDPPSAFSNPMHELAWSFRNRCDVPVLHTKYIVEQHRREDIEEDKSEADAVVAPSRVVGNSYLRQKLIRYRQRAVLALCRALRIHQLPHRSGCGGKITREVLPACLASRGSKAREFVGGADDGLSVHPGCCDTIDEIGQGGYAVHKDPEAGEGLWGLHDALEISVTISKWVEGGVRLTVECECKREEQGCDTTSCLRIRQCRNEHMGEC